ncbi:MAG: sugar phosphate nucleotidyltransferase [Candidatus Eremiobacteraeota bacterium]|nr:sugar phosphate nucleotidyltransferase [Candidatus Eremiobacteraeota bacterium]
MNSVRNTVLAMIMAGGVGRKLEVLTSDVRAQSAVPFGGKYRLIDFALSNFFNSEIKKINVLIQHKSLSLVQHIEENWNYRFGSSDEFIRVLGPMPPHWQKGTADSVHQNISRIKIENPDMVAVFAGDHVYRMDIREMVKFHREKEAHLTICAIRFPLKKSTGRFGIIERDEKGRLVHFEEKSSRHIPIKGDEDHMWISMGNYIFDREILIEALEHNSRLPDKDTKHDFGNDIIPMLMKKEGIRIFVYEFTGLPGEGGRSTGKPGYWRDIGNVDSYYEASMDLLEEKPLFDLYNPSWPLYSVNTDNLPPPRFYGDFNNGGNQQVTHSIVSDGCVLRGCHIHKSILFPGTEVNSGSELRESIVFDGVKIGKGCRIEKAIIDKCVVVPDGTVIKGGKVDIPKGSAALGKGVKKAGEEEQQFILERFKGLVEKSHATASGIVAVPRYYELVLYTGS